MRTYIFSIGAAEAGRRLDHCLAQRLPASVSRAMIQRGIREGLVTVGGRCVKAHYPLRRGDRVTANITQLPAPARDLPLTSQEIPLEILHEDADLLVVNKPAGLVTHPAPGHWSGTLVNGLLWHLRQVQGSRFKVEGRNLQPRSLHRTRSSHEPRTSNLEPPLGRAGIVHRLDKDTSGALLVAKTDAAHLSLSRQLKARAIRRRYLALVEGRLPLETGTINAPLGRHLRHRKEMTVRHLGGRTAVTHYRVLRRFDTLSLEPRAPSCTLIEVSLETGRTHQIRVHLAHVGHPVVGDTTYGSHPAGFWHAAGVPRQLLHAYRLSFQHPSTGRPVTISAPVPDDLSPWCNTPLKI